jgi:hypothetical protein
MGILSKIITTKLVEGVIETVGKVTVTTTIGIMEGKAKHGNLQENNVETKKKNLDQPQKEKYKVERVKQDDGRIKAPCVEELLGQHYLKVRAAFVGAGFEDVSYILKKDLVKGWIRKDGEVSEISINGRTEIGRRAKFLPTSPVVIVYHAFRE